MDIEIKKLTPELTEDYIRFFDDFPGETPEERGCYCSSWCAEDHREGADCLSTPEKRRASAIDYISRGTLQGYLAYADGKAVGWCNANTKTDCVNSFFWFYLMKDVPVSAEEKVKSVYCFTVDPAYRGRGIAEGLLRRVCEDAAADGFDVVEGYPNTMLSNVSFMGPRRLYEKLGFEVYMEVNNMSVMRKCVK